MSEDGDFDYRTLPKAQIEYALKHIDGSRFPGNLKNAEAALADRISGLSPEPDPILDKVTDAKYTYWVEKIIGAVLASCAAFALIYDDLPITLIGRPMGQSRVLHLHGPAAWIGSLALLLAASIPFLGGLRNADPLAIRPRFRLVYRIAIILMVVALIVGKLGAGIK
jgi:hypothetical protein